MADIALGSLQWVQFEVVFFNFLLDVRGKIAGALCPLYGGLAVGLAIGTYFVCRHSIAPLTGLHDGITSPTVVGTAAFLHENTFCPYFDGLTNHGNQPPF